MRASIYKSEIKGTVKAPSSKSYTIRGLVSAALARGRSELLNPLSSDDTEASQDVLSKTGIVITRESEKWTVDGGRFSEPEADLYCRESAATLRFMTAISSIIPGVCRLTMAPPLARRPLLPLVQALRKLGVECSYEKGAACLTVASDVLKGGTTELPGNISSQYVSALLFAAPLAEENITIRLTTPLESQSFLKMTLECLKSFGITVEHSGDLREYNIKPQEYKPHAYQVEGDWSSASYLLALGALSGKTEIKNLNPDSLQGDRVILDLLREMGASISAGENNITVEKSRLRAIKADLNDCIDLLPTMAILASAAEGASEFTGIERARLKESNRVSAVKEGLQKMGISSCEEQDSLSITGSPAREAVIDSRGDHRIAMSFGVLGTAWGGVEIENAECVSKTYPGFWDTLRLLGGEVKINGE